MSSDNPKVMRGSARCSVCGGRCLNGVMPVEPPFFCPDHPHAPVVRTVTCPTCNGLGAVDDAAVTVDDTAAREDEAAIEAVSRILGAGLPSNFSYAKDGPILNQAKRIVAALRELWGPAAVPVAAADEDTRAEKLHSALRAIARTTGHEDPHEALSKIKGIVANALADDKLRAGAAGVPAEDNPKGIEGSRLREASWAIVEMLRGKKLAVVDQDKLTHLIVTLTEHDENTEPSKPIDLAVKGLDQEMPARRHPVSDPCRFAAAVDADESA